MLSKVSNATVTGMWPQRMSTGAITASYTNASEIKETAFTINEKLIGFQIHRVSLTDVGSTHYVYINNTKVFDSGFVPWTKFWTWKPDDVYLPYQTWPWTTWNSIITSVKGSESSSTTKNIVYSFIYDIYTNITIAKNISTRKSLPRELKAIGEKATSTLFGYHTDNTRYTGE